MKERNNATRSPSDCADTTQTNQGMRLSRSMDPSIRILTAREEERSLTQQWLLDEEALIKQVSQGNSSLFSNCTRRMSSLYTGFATLGQGTSQMQRMRPPRRSSGHLKSYRRTAISGKISPLEPFYTA